MRARRAGQRVYGECLVQHLVVDDSVHYLKDAQSAIMDMINLKSQQRK